MRNSRKVRKKTKPGPHATRPSTSVGNAKNKKVKLHPPTADHLTSSMGKAEKEVEAEEAIIQNISRLCDAAEALSRAEEVRLAQQYTDLPILEPTPQEPVATLGMEGDIGDDGRLHSSKQPSPLVLPARKRGNRMPTRMARLTSRNPGKVKVEFDRRLETIGPNKGIIDNFISYLGVLGRKHASIMIDSWKNVHDNTKELIWQAILEKFEIFFIDDEKEVEFSLVDVKKQNRFRMKWLRYVGRRWTVFKTNLTTNYIYGEKKDVPPYVNDYQFLDPDIWDAFVASRLTEEYKVKREKAKKLQSNNKCPQRCSRGGYKLLKQKIIEEKYKARREASGDPSEVIPPPSPPSRHEAWKRARITSTGQYVTPEASTIAEKIESLEEQQSQGRFNPSGRNDVLAVAIGKPERPGCVRGVGKGHTLRTYFGKPQLDGMVSREEVDVIIASRVAEMQKKLRAEMLMMFSSQVATTPAPETPVVQSAKGSCAPDLMVEDIHEEHDDEYELYVEDPQRRLVAYGRLHNLGSTIHHKIMKADEVRVTVVRVVVGDALVPFPTDEVTTVGEAPNQFIAWPRSLVQSVTHKGISKPKELDPKPQSQPETRNDVLKHLWVSSADITQPKYISLEAGIVSEKADHSVQINQEDIMGLLLAREISISVMQFYNKYLHSILKLSGRNDRYGLMCPLIIESRGNTNEEIGMLLRKRIVEGDFECFLAPIYESYWQLMVLCPKNNSVAWFCSKGKKPKKKISDKIEMAYDAYQMMKGTHTYQLKKPQWVYPKCLDQRKTSDTCGFFVMRHMLEIIQLDIVDSFEKALNMEQPYSDDEIDDVRRRWAECLLEVIV